MIEHCKGSKLKADVACEGIMFSCTDHEALPAFASNSFNTHSGLLGAHLHRCGPCKNTGAPSLTARRVHLLMFDKKHTPFVRS